MQFRVALLQIHHIRRCFYWVVSRLQAKSRMCGPCWIIWPLVPWISVAGMQTIPSSSHIISSITWYVATMMLLRGASCKDRLCGYKPLSDYIQRALITLHHPVQVYEMRNPVHIQFRSSCRSVVEDESGRAIFFSIF